MKTLSLFHTILVLSLLLLPTSLSQIIPGHSALESPTVNYQLSGPTTPFFFTGDGERINNTSFEVTMQPWISTTYNANVSSAQIVSPGYNDNSAAQLTIRSGNLTVSSYQTLFQDFSKNPVAFGNSIRFRAAVQVQSLQGNATSDRIEASLTLTSSIGVVTRIHYVFASGASSPANTTSDAFFKVPSFGASGWIQLDRNVAADALSGFPSLYTSIGSVKDIRLTVYSASLGNSTYDPRIKYYETAGDNYWNKTVETVVFDPDSDGIYHAATDKLLYNGTSTPLEGQVLSNDRQIKFVDLNMNGRWDPGEPIVYDLKNEGVYDVLLDPIISGSPIAGSLLQDPIRRSTTALFDQVELYSATGNYDWVHNGGFETGNLNAWGNTAGFTANSVYHHSGSYSAQGSTAGGTANLAQSIEVTPTIDSSTRLTTSAFIATMTGPSLTDRADEWLGLVDSSSQANPLSIYFYFKTGTGTIPANTTDTLNFNAPGFGSSFQWLTINQTLLPDTGYFNLQGYTAPYHIQIIALEVSSQTGSTTTAYFDDVSLPTLYKPGSASSSFYALDGLNSTYIYYANNIPQGSFYINLPAGQSVLNVTSPEGPLLSQTDYASQSTTGNLQVTVPVSTMFKHAAYGNWKVYTTSKNPLSKVYAADPTTHAEKARFDPGTSANIVSKNNDPLGNPLVGAKANLLLYSSLGAVLGNWTGVVDTQGIFAASITLPATIGTYTLAGEVASGNYIGLRTTQLTVATSIPWTAIAYGATAAVGLGLFGLLLFRRRRKRTLPRVEAMSANPSAPKV